MTTTTEIVSAALREHPTGLGLVALRAITGIEHKPLSLALRQLTDAGAVRRQAQAACDARRPGTVRYLLNECLPSPAPDHRPSENIRVDFDAASKRSFDTGSEAA